MLVVKLRKVCVALLCVGIDSDDRIDLDGHSERFRVERNSVLCGHLYGDVGIFVVVNFGNKFCVLCAHICLLSMFMFFLS
jgi:hypothetical protein